MYVCVMLSLCFLNRYVDMESEDYAFYQGLVFLLENNVADLGYDLTFSTEVGCLASFSFVLHVKEPILLIFIYL